MAQLYYFDLLEDGRLMADEKGVELASVLDVQREAQRCAAWIAAGYREGRRPAVASIRVRDASGALCLEVPVAPSNSVNGHRLPGA